MVKEDTSSKLNLTLRWSAAMALVACVAVRAACVQGLWRPVRTAGGSMADVLLGDRYELACRECGFRVRYDAESPPADGRVVCPNCGGINAHDDSRLWRGQRVLLDGAAYVLAGPHRWEIVAAAMPDERLSPEQTRRHTSTNAPSPRYSGERVGERGAPSASLAHGVCGRPCSGVRLTVKRVVGLPGETIAIRHGDLYVNGRVEQKSLDQLREVAVLVHDDAFRPKSVAGVSPRVTLPERWRSEDDDSGWHRQWDRWRCRGENAHGHRYDWLRYHHWRCFASPLPRTAPCPVLDNDGFNQGESRQLQAVADLLLTCVLRTGGPAGSLALEVDDGSHGYRAELFPEERRGRLLCQGTAVAEFPLPAAAFAQGVLIEWATCDGRVMLAVDRQVVLVHQCAPAQDGREPSPTPLAIGVRGFPVEIRRLQVRRDVHYLDPPGLGRDWEAPRTLGADEYFLLGDNAAVSQDSRHWPALAVPRRSVIGQVWR